MKKVLFTSVLLLASSTFAAKFETCAKEIRESCGQHASHIADLAAEGTDCKIIQKGTREDGSAYPTKVIMKDSNTLFSVMLPQGPRACDMNRVDIKGRFVEDKALEGRLFAVTADGSVIVIARNNSIQYLTNSGGNPFGNVVDIAVDDRADKLSLTLENKQVTELGLSQILKRLNESGYIKCVGSNSCR